jgi:undecaprenyl-diphosphatase
MTVPCATGIDTGFVTLGYAKVAVLGGSGITELLPISSTAHMRVVPALLGWRDRLGVFGSDAIGHWRYELFLAGCALAVGSGSAIRQRRFNDPELRLAIWIALATVPITLAGILRQASSIHAVRRFAPCL